MDAISPKFFHYKINHELKSANVHLRPGVSSYHGHTINFALGTLYKVSDNVFRVVLLFLFQNNHVAQIQTLGFNSFWGEVSEFKQSWIQTIALPTLHFLIGIVVVELLSACASLGYEALTQPFNERNDS